MTGSATRASTLRRKVGSARTVGTSRTCAGGSRPSGSAAQIAWFASNSVSSAKRKASSMRGPQKRSNSRRKIASAFDTALSRSQPSADVEQVQPERPRRSATSR